MHCTLVQQQRRTILTQLACALGAHLFFSASSAAASASRSLSAADGVPLIRPVSRLVPSFSAVSPPALSVSVELLFCNGHTHT